ncbi:MAG: hypothetical protein WED10_08560 [Brumimicrobium sp.]
MTTKYQEKKKEMIKDIIKYSDLYKSIKELEVLDIDVIESIYNSCMIPFLKKIENHSN